MVIIMDNKWNIGEGGEMPIGFGLSLAANAKSMEAFANMTDAEKQKTIKSTAALTGGCVGICFCSSLFVF